MAKPTKSKYENARAWIKIYNQLRGLVLNQFEWEGLEKYNIPEEWLETLLYENGRCTVFLDPDNGILCLPSTDGPQRNTYNYPLHYIVTGNSYHRTVNAAESVLIRNNKTEHPTDAVVRYYADRLYEIQRTMDTNVKQQKFPFVFSVDANNLLTFKAIFDKIDDNEVAIYADKNLDLENAVGCVQTGAPFILDKMADYMHDTFNNFLTEIGFNNANTDKRERLVTDEVNSNNEVITAYMNVRLSEREKACHLMKSVLGMDVSVKRRETAPGNVMIGGATDVSE